MKKTFVVILWMICVGLVSQSYAQKREIDKGTYLDKASALVNLLDCMYAYKNVSVSYKNFKERKLFTDIIAHCADTRTLLNQALEIVDYANLNKVRSDCQRLYPEGVDNDKLYVKCFQLLRTGKQTYAQLEASWRVIPIAEGSPIAVANKTQHFFTWNEVDKTIDFADGYSANDFARYIVSLNEFSSVHFKNFFETSGGSSNTKIRMWGDRNKKNEGAIPAVSLIDYSQNRGKINADGTDLLPGLSMLRNIIKPTAEVLIQVHGLFPTGDASNQKMLNEFGYYSHVRDVYLRENGYKYINADEGEGFCDRACWQTFFLQQFTKNIGFSRLDDESEGFASIDALYERLLKKQSLEEAPYRQFPFHDR